MCKFIFLTSLCFLAIACSGNYTKQDFVLDTVCTIDIDGSGNGYKQDQAINAAFDYLFKFDDEISPNKKTSDIVKVNAAAGKNAVAVGQATWDIVNRGIRYAQLSAGAFDPSIGPLVKLWGIGTSEENIPTAEAIKATRAKVNWQKIILDADKKTVQLVDAGMALELGSASKGYAADKVAQILRDYGVNNALIDLGGNVLAIGQRPDHTPWRIGLQNPFGLLNNNIAVIQASNESVVTSGVYQRFFEKDGVRYHHILDVKTGAPIQNHLYSVTVIARQSFDCDGVTTMLFLLGKDGAIALAQKLGLKVIIIDDQKNIFVSDNLQKQFTLTNSEFKLSWFPVPSKAENSSIFN